MSVMTHSMDTQEDYSIKNLYILLNIITYLKFKYPSIQFSLL